MAAKFKLSVSETLALFQAVQSRIGLPTLLAAVTAALGKERATLLLSRQKGFELTRKEVVSLIKAIVPLIPGDTTKAKVLWFIKTAKSCFATDERFAEVVAYCRRKVEEFRAAGGDWETWVDVDATPFDNSFLRFYGRVNMWAAAGEDELRKDIDLCGKVGVGYHIEMAGWRSGETAFDGADKLAATVTMYRKLIGWCRAAKIPLFISITNRNITETKYGNVGRPFASIVPAAQQLAQAVFDEGPEGQYVQPVAENNGDAAAVAFEKGCGTLFAGWNLVYNGNGGQATGPAHGWPMFSFHPASVGTDIPNGALASSDHGLIIRALASDSSLDGPGNPGKIRAWFDHCKASGAIGAAYYAFRREKHDPEAIRACGKQESAPSQAGEPDLASAKWIGFNGAAAVATETLSNLTINAKEIRFTLSDGCRLWEPHEGAKQTNQKACFFVVRDGRAIGGRFDDSGYPRVTRELKNIRGGYTGGIIPKTGEVVWFCFTDVKGTRRTNCASAVWP